MVQQHFLNKYYFQRVPNQVEKLRKFQGAGYDKHPLERKFQRGGGSKTKCPSSGGGGGYGYFLKLHIDRSLSTKNIN